MNTNGMAGEGVSFDFAQDERMEWRSGRTDRMEGLVVTYRGCEIILWMPVRP